MIRVAVLSCALLTGLTLAPALAVVAETITVTPAEDEKAVLHNPDMGWVLYENLPVDPNPDGGSSTMLTLPGEPFEGVDEVAVMFTWYDVEKTPDAYDFTAVDRAYDYWRKLGKRIQLRMSTETLLWWDNATPPAGKGPPDYVVAKLSDAEKQVRRVEGLPPYLVVDARNAYYLERLEKFLAAVAGHYRGEREVTLVDLRGFGVWGEWHQGFQYPSLDERRRALIGVIDRYAAAFRTTGWRCATRTTPTARRSCGPARATATTRSSRPTTTRSSATPPSTTRSRSPTSPSAATAAAGPCTPTSGSSAPRRSPRSPAGRSCPSSWTATPRRNAAGRAGSSGRWRTRSACTPITSTCSATRAATASRSSASGAT
jgi:hypothetical protein